MQKKIEEIKILQQMEFYQREYSNNPNNKVWVKGIIAEDFSYDKKIHSYRSKIRIKRFNEKEDSIPIVVSDGIMDKFKETSLNGVYIEIDGQFRSHNRYEKNGKLHVDLYIFVTNMNLCELTCSKTCSSDVNLIYLEGYVCKKPNFRLTPLGGKDLTELLIAVNRRDGSDYIPCITWDRLAKYSRGLEVGNKVCLYGRLQSKQYLKDGQIKLAYETSIWKLAKL